MNEPGPILLEKRIAAPPATIYPYLIDPALTPRWLGADSLIEATAGGLFMLESPNTMVAEGVVVEIEHNKKVSFTWGWNGHPSIPPGSTLVEIELIPDGDGTIVRLTHSALEIDDQPIHRQGWNHYLERLDILIGGDDPGPDPGAG